MRLFGRGFKHAAKLAQAALAITLFCAIPAHAETLPATQATLAAVLKLAKPGDEIRVSGLITGPVSANFPAPGVTITCEEGASIGPDPRSKWFTVTGSGMTFRGCPVASGGGPGIGVLTGSTRIAFDRMDFAGLGALATAGGSCLSVRDSSDISLTNSRCHDATGGVSVGAMVRGITVSGNDFRDLWYDAIHIKALGGVVVEGNTITDFRGPPLHLDAIQLEGASATEPVTGVVIRGNRYTRGTGTPAQFVFMSDSVLGYTDFDVSGNAAWGPAFHGVTILRPGVGVVADNYLQGSSVPWAGQVLTPWIKFICDTAPCPGAINADTNRLPPPSATPDALTAWLGRNDDPRDVALADALKARDDARAVAASLIVERDVLAARLAVSEAMVEGVRKAVQP